MTTQPSNSGPDRPSTVPDGTNPAAGEYLQPAVPPLTSDNVDPVFSLDLEPTQVDPFGARDGAYPDFSYADQTSTRPIPDIVDPNPFPAPSNYAQPTVPPRPRPTELADPLNPEPSGFVAETASPSALTPATYQSYPAPTPAGDPIRYDYGYQAPPVVDHPNAVPALLLGIGSLVIFSPLGIVGLVLAQRGRRDVAAQPGRWASGGTLTAGFILSLIGTVLTGLAVIAVLVMMLVMVVAAAAAGA